MMNNIAFIELKQIIELVDDINNLTDFCAFLAKQNDYKYLRMLEIILLIKTKKYPYLNIKKHINFSVITNIHDDYRESIINNLINNPSNYASEILDFIIISFSGKIRNSFNEVSYGIYTSFDQLVNYFRNLENSNNNFYKRYDIVEKRLEIIMNLIEKNMVDNNRLQDVEFLFKNKNKKREFNFTERQRMMLTIAANKISLLLKLNDLENKLEKKDFEEFKKLIMSTGNVKQVETIDVLRKLENLTSSYTERSDNKNIKETYKLIKKNRKVINKDIKV